MINFSIAIESIENFKSPENFFLYLTPEEIKNKQKISLVGKIALKKAFFDCIKKEERNFKKIEVKNLVSGRPYIEIKDKKIKEKLKDKKFSFSISHTKDLAVAVFLIYDGKD